MSAGLLVVLMAVGGGPWHVPHPHKEGTPEPGKARVIPHTMERAGSPQGLANHVTPSVTPGGVGGYVGGGVCWGKGSGRRAELGTWGYDDTGFHLFRHRSVLGWSQGRRWQGGAGAYRTDGVAVPDVVAGLHGLLEVPKR